MNEFEFELKWTGNGTNGVEVIMFHDVFRAALGSRSIKTTIYGSTTATTIKWCSLVGQETLLSAAYIAIP
jgi:hypothetical protein